MLAKQVGQQSGRFDWRGPRAALLSPPVLVALAPPTYGQLLPT